MSAQITYDTHVKPVLARRCLPCHSAGEMRSGLNVESFNGILKGGGSGDVVKPGRPTTSILYLAVAHEGNGIPRMPVGGARIPEAEINIIKEWIAQGLLENPASQPKGPVAPSFDYKPAAMNKPTTPAMLAKLPVAPPKPKARAHPVTAIAASPWAPLLAVAGHETITLYNLESRQPIGALPFPEGIPYVLRFSRDGAILLAAGGKGAQTGKVALYDVATGQRTITIGQEVDIILAADISAGGKLVALGGPNKIVKVFSTATGQQIYQLTKHTDWITALEFSPDGSKLATADRAGGIHLWESAAGGIIVTLAEHKDSVNALTWRPDGKLLASAGEDGELAVWDVAEGFPIATDTKAHIPPAKGPVYGTPQSGILSAAYSNDGRIATVGRDRIVHLWSTLGKHQSASKQFPQMLTRLTTSADGNLVIIGDYNGGVTLWDGKQALPLHVPQK
ncbi:MAG: hypothetical protein HY820_17800 [Acidobacteria bacterium]|nr:hypothetical protein [Acidobacteriota bacterium]